MGTKQACPIDMTQLDPFNLSRTDLHQILRQVAMSERIMTPVSDLHPKLFVGYERDYYQGANGIRITMDRHLAFQDLTNDRGIGIKETHQDLRLILEFKFPSNQKDQVAEMMVALPFSAARSSKYIFGLAHIGKTVYF